MRKIESIDTPLKFQVLKQLYFDGALSCADLSEALDKSLPLIAKAINEMMDAGFVVENGYARSTGGRKPLLYTIKSGYIYIVSVVMDQLYTIIKILDVGNNAEMYSTKAELKLLNNDSSLDRLRVLIEEVIDASGIHKDDFIGMGLGMPGFVNIKLGINQSYLFTHTSESLKDYLERVFDMPVFIDNDSSVIALAESKFGLAKGRQDVMVINIGWGIGLGMIMDGKMFRGHTGYAGEFSHIPIADGDIMCECGKRGCLETVATLRTVAQAAIDKITKGYKTNLQIKDSAEEMCEEVMNAANKGDQFAIQLLSDMAYKIGKAIAILIHINSPEQVLLSGRGAAVGKILMAPIQQALNQYCIPRLFEHTVVDVSTLKFKAYPIGAAALVMENLSDTRVYVPRQSVKEVAF
jgi:predicted NBD/HSP70 family sugar kinase